MGVKLIVLVGLLAGVLYCLHLLAQDFIAIRMPKFLRFLGKRDLSSKNIHKPHVRWKKILFHDPLRCARLLYCEIGIRGPLSDLHLGFIHMLTLEPKEEDETSLDVFKEAYEYGKLLSTTNTCRLKYPTCPFAYQTMVILLEHMINNKKMD